jgi:hypothetical protein
LAVSQSVRFTLGNFAHETAMTILGYILFGLGCIAGLIGDVRFLVLTYRHGVGWFLTCLIFPIIGWVFFLLHAKDVWQPVVLSIAGFIVAGIGYSIAEFEFLS